MIYARRGRTRHTQNNGGDFGWLVCMYDGLFIRKKSCGEIDLCLFWSGLIGMIGWDVDIFEWMDSADNGAKFWIPRYVRLTYFTYPASTFEVQDDAFTTLERGA